MKNILFIPLAFCFCLLSCQQDELAFNDLDAEIEFRSKERIVRAGGTIVIGTICPECPVGIRGDGGDGDDVWSNPGFCIELNEDGSYTFNVELISKLTPFTGSLDLIVSGIVAEYELISELYVEASDNEVEAYHYVAAVTISGEEICGNSGGTGIGNFQIELDFQMIDETGQVDPVVLPFCCTEDF